MKRRRALLFSIAVVLALCAACGGWLHRERQQYALNRQLIDALEEDDTKQAIVLVNAGGDPNTRQEPPMPSLKLLINQLLHHTPAPANDRPTAFIIACGPRLFLNSSGNTTWGRQPHFPHEDVVLVQTMLRHGADVQARYMQHYTALFGAMNDDRLPTVELLLQHGTNINAQDEHGGTPLMFAVEEEDFPLMRLLLSYGANPNIQDTYGNTALHCATSSRIAKRLIVELLAHGANPNIQDTDGNTSLQLAQKANRTDLVHLLKCGTK